MFEATLVAERKEGKARGLKLGLKRGMEKGMEKGLVKGRAEGRTEGRAEGRTEGRAEGRTEGRALSLLDVLSMRGIEVSSDVSDRIKNCVDLDCLDVWFKRAMTISGVEALFDP
jgi:flagellar biosynthesis/type III secretory pathway protein FliH